MIMGGRKGRQFVQRSSLSNCGLLRPSGPVTVTVNGVRFSAQPKGSHNMSQTMVVAEPCRREIRASRAGTADAPHEKE